MARQNKPSRTKRFFKNNLLTLLTMLGVVLGVGLGIGLRSIRTNWTQREVMYISYLGDIFLQMLKGLILPLIVCSIVEAIGSLDLRLSGSIGSRAICYYFSTTLLAVFTGIAISLLIKPGEGHMGNAPTKDLALGRNITTVDTFLDLVRNMFPPNLIQAATHQMRTVLITPNATDSDKPLTEWAFEQQFNSGMNVLGLVVFAVALGSAISATASDISRPVVHLFRGLSAALMKITKWVIWLSPGGILFLVAGKIVEMESFEVLLGQVGLYFGSVILGLAIHSLITLPLLFLICTKKLPFRFMLNMSQALATGFGTGSSNAALPVSMSCLEEKNKVDPRVVRFIMPIGATINMDGTALYEALAAIFIAQVRGVSLTVGKIFAISLTATAASIGAAAIPQAGLITMVMVLDTIGLPAEDVTLVIAVDWLLDRFRTSVNVLGDSMGAGIVQHLSRKDLKIITTTNDQVNGLDV